MIVFTDQELSKLPESEKTMYEAYVGIIGILQCIEAKTPRSSQSFLEAEHQLRIAQLLLEHALGRPCYKAEEETPL